MDYKSTIKYCRMSPMKIQRLATLVRGQSVVAGLAALRFLPHRGARLLEKVIRAAIANAEDRGIRNVESLVISSAVVNSGPTLKRIQPHARGMGFMIKKRTSHITVSVGLPR
jgi:large subunit ribosomal protein L22